MASRKSQDNCRNGGEMKHPVISMNLLKQNFLKIGDVSINLELPKGCLGVMLVFESKKSAKEFNRNAPLCRIEVDKNNKE